MMDPAPAAKIGKVLTAELDKLRTISSIHFKGGHRD